MRIDRLKQSRLNSRFTQEELAEKLNTVKTQISRWERGESVPHADTLTELSRLFNVSVDYLLGLSDEPTIRMRFDNLTLEEMAILTALRKDDEKEAIKIIVTREKRPPVAV